MGRAQLQGLAAGNTGLCVVNRNLKRDHIGLQSLEGFSLPTSHPVPKGGTSDDTASASSAAMAQNDKVIEQVRPFRPTDFALCRCGSDSWMELIHIDIKRACV